MVEEKSLETVLKLLEEGHISADEVKKLLGKEPKQKKLSSGFSRRLRNFIIGALIAGGLSGLLIFKASQPNISIRTEEELRRIIAEGVARDGAGYFSMPITTEGVDYDGKLYSIKFHHDKGKVIEKGREFIIPMSVEKEGRTYWYNIRVRDDQFVYMKRRSTFGDYSKN